MMMTDAFMVLVIIIHVAQNLMTMNLVIKNHIAQGLPIITHFAQNIVIMTQDLQDLMIMIHCALGSDDIDPLC